MNSIKFNDWQEMALKKDTEAILKKLNVQEPIIYSLCWEITIALGVIIVDHLFDTQETASCVWIFCVAMAVLPPLILIVVKMFKWVNTVREVKSGVYKIRHFVDTFDNQICYWVMMCNSYSHILSSSDNKTEKIFLYHEGCYYNNKSMQALYKMKPVINKVFSADHEKVLKNNLIAIYRLLSLLEMMNQYQIELDNNVEDLKNDRAVKEQIEINHTYQEQIKRFIKDMNVLFSTKFEWKE